MRLIAAATATALLLAGSAQAECRRVTTPTVMAIVVHGGVWTRPVKLGETLRVSKCGIRIEGRSYCQLETSAQPPVYVQDSDPSGREYTAFWGKSCR